ncbi:MAG: isoaspartyl peptidase/L-asparaginase family protein [Pseudomonadales bacterium]
MGIKTARALAGLLAAFTLTACQSAPPVNPSTSDQPIAIALHGGAGTITRANLKPEQEAEFRTALGQALDRGYEILSAGGSSLDAITATITLMERSPLFNAGVGAVYTWDGGHELDASIMAGRDLQAGAVAGVTTIKSPIAAARAVMEHSPHVLLSGAGAEAFAQSRGLATVSNDHFDTPSRKASLERVKAELQRNNAQRAEPLDYKFGTVGVVALDRSGDLAAGTSTGGMTAKRWGRIGDSPVIGAGTYADNRSCAVSATGHGEFFIRYNVAADICARVRYKGVSIREAGRQVLFDELLPNGGTGGVIIMSPTGTVAMPFNTEGMYRAKIDANGEREIAIYGDDQ